MRRGLAPALRSSVTEAIASGMVEMKIATARAMLTPGRGRVRCQHQVLGDAVEEGTQSQRGGRSGCGADGRGSSFGEPVDGGIGDGEHDRAGGQADGHPVRPPACCRPWPARSKLTALISAPTSNARTVPMTWSGHSRTTPIAAPMASGEVAARAPRRGASSTTSPPGAGNERGHC
jgi:hypothetical protein